VKPPSDKDLTVVAPGSVTAGERPTVRVSVLPYISCFEEGSTVETQEDQTQVFGCTGLVTCICADCLLASLGEPR
jgi:hypothetical protein